MSRVAIKRKSQSNEKPSLLDGPFDNLLLFLLPPDPDPRALSISIEKAFRAAWQVAWSSGKWRTSKSTNIQGVFQSHFEWPARSLQIALDEHKHLITPMPIGRLAKELAARPDAFFWIQVNYGTHISDREPELMFTRDTHGPIVLGEEAFANAHLAALSFAFTVATECIGVRLPSNPSVKDTRRTWQDLRSNLDREVPLSAVTKRQYNDVLAKLRIECVFAERRFTAKKTVHQVASAQGNAIISLGSRTYQIAGYRPVVLPDQMDSVLQAFLEAPGNALDHRDLIDKAGFERAPKTLADIEKRHTEFAPAIRRPKVKGAGYHVNIISTVAPE